MVFDDQFKSAQSELNEKKEHLKSIRPTTAKMKFDQHQIKLLENQLDKALVKYNDIQSQNKGLRGEIDVCRKQQKNQLRVNEAYSREIKNTIQSVKKLNALTYKGQHTSEETNNQILALKAKHELDKFNFEHKIMDLQLKLKERDDNNEEKKSTKENEKKKATGSTPEFSNPAAFLKVRMQKWVNNNKEKKHLMDMYIRNVKIIEDAFDQIKEATGISAVEEIVTTFNKAEDQNISLQNFVHKVSSEIDMIEEQNKQIEDEIKRYEELGEMTNKEKDQVRNNLDKEI